MHTCLASIPSPLVGEGEDGGNPTTCIWPEWPIRLRRIYRWWDNQTNTPHLLTWDTSPPIRHKTRRDSSTKRFGTDSADPLWRTRGGGINKESNLQSFTYISLCSSHLNVNYRGRAGTRGQLSW